MTASPLNRFKLVLAYLTLSILMVSFFSANATAEQTDFGAFDSSVADSSEDEFLPVTEAYKLALDFTEENTLLAQWQIADGYYLYKDRFKFSTPATEQLSVKLAKGKEKNDEYFGLVEVYYYNTEAEITNLPQAPFILEITSQGCADAGLCYPPYTEHYRIDPINKTVAPASADDDIASTTEVADNVDSESISEPQNILTMLLLAAAGGMILNLMPCVFPVLSLKVMSFVNDEDHSHALHGIIYTLGVVISFVAVAALLLSLRSAGEAIGWGFHLQSPVFVAVLVYVFLIMGLSFSGAIELGASWTNVGSNLAVKPGYAGSFFTGILATVVASPCTAPFMGASLGWAITQPTSIALLVFAALGFGMALPILVLCLSPKLLHRLPKPGAWMERFKQFLAFPLYATIVWLIWVIGRQAGVNAMALILLGCVLIALAIWLWGGGLIRRLLSLLCLLSALLFLASPIVSTKVGNTASTEAAYWQSYSPELLASLRAEKRPVFVNITADWCITCLTNEKTTLSGDTFKQTLEENNIVYLKGDWTNRDPIITELLAQYRRNGIPLYLAFPADPSKNAIVLPQILRPGSVLPVLRSLKNDSL